MRVLCTVIGARTAWRGDSLSRAARYIEDAFAAAGLGVTRQSYDYQGRQVANIIAAPVGVDTRAPYYVVGAHYDTVPSTPGADDNASGIAVLLELARRLSSHPRALRLVAFTLEEAPAYMTGHQGSRRYVQELARRGDEVLGAVVLEMVGFTAPRQTYPAILKWAGYPESGDFIGVVGNWRSRRFGRRLIQGFRRNPSLPVESHFTPFNGELLPATRLSDHASFWDEGWPAVMVTDTAFFRNPNYHLPSDRPETLDYDFMAELVESLALALDELTPPPVQP